MKSMYYIFFISFTLCVITSINAAIKQSNSSIEPVIDQFKTMNIFEEFEKCEEKEETIFFKVHGHNNNGSLIAYNKDPKTIRHTYERNLYKIGIVEFKQSEHHSSEGFIRNLFIIEDYTKHSDSIVPHLIIHACKILYEAGCTVVQMQSPVFENITLSFERQADFTEGHIVAYYKNPNPIRYPKKGTDNVIGFIEFKQNNRDYGKGCLDNIFVAGKYRKHGVGTHLLEYACKFLYESGCKVIETKTQRKNDNAASFLRKNGFKEEVSLRNGNFDDLQDPLLCEMLIFRKNAPI